MYESQNLETLCFYISTEDIETFVISLEKIQNASREKFRDLHTEKPFNGLFDFIIASKAPSKQEEADSYLVQDQDCMCVCGGSRRRPQPRATTWFCVAVNECGLTLTSNNRTQGLRSPGCFFHITSFNFDRVLQYSVALMVQPPRKSKRLFRM
ncbi:hypothetical protein TNCV_2109581 [Trichonephila clavipes]|nr:hypothetical protein TNCV_2109581 [Trichonephila clavipes]